jgi:hypothetical protein
MYQPYPGDQSPQQYGQAGRLVLGAPPPVARAVKLMYAGAAATLIGIVVNLTTESSVKSQLLKRSPNLRDHPALAAPVVGLLQRQGRAALLKSAPGAGPERTGRRLLATRPRRPRR